jgi:hypothetical protein
MIFVIEYKFWRRVYSIMTSTKIRTGLHWEVTLPEKELANRAFSLVSSRRSLVVVEDNIIYLKIKRS